MKTYLFTFCLSMLISMGLTPLVIEFARRKKLCDEPNARSVHSESIPRLGGIAIFVATMMLIFPVMLLHNPIGQTFRDLNVKVIVMLTAASIMFATGLIDDIKGIRIRTKFAAQILAAILVCSFGIRIDSITVPGLFTIDFGWFGWVVTMLWIVGITNAVNITDGLDGLAAGIIIIACGVIALLSIYLGNVVLAVLMLALSGSLLGFLFFNYNPAKIFMGDCGSLFIGFVIAVSSVITSAKSHALVGIALPILVLGVPIFDTFFSMLRRFIQRRSMTSADRGHFHHRLLDHGFSQHHAAIIAYAITFVMGGLGFLLVAARSAASIVIFLGCLLLLLLVFRIVGAIRLREIFAGLKSRTHHHRSCRTEQKAFEQAQLNFKNAEDFNDWWNCLCRAAEGFDFSSMSLPLTTRDGNDRLLTWQKQLTTDSRSLIANEFIQMKIPIREIKAGPIHNLEVSVNKNGSLESAGRRTALFNRLLDQNKIFDLPKS